MVCAKHKDLPKARSRSSVKSARPRWATPSVAKAAPAGKAKKASPKLARARKLQGQYLGALKSLSAADKNKVKAVAKDKGVAEALKMAVSLKKPSK